MDEVREQWIIVGAEREGKTFLSKKYAESYVKSGKGGLIVYNFGDKDFGSSDYLEIEPLTFAEHLSLLSKGVEGSKDDIKSYRLDKRVTYFRFNGKVYHFKNFNQIFQRRKVRIAKVFNLALERKLMQALFIYVSDFLLLLDDTKAIFTYGIKSEFLNLFGRKNHTGKEAVLKTRLGLDIICIFHSWGSVNAELLTYTNSIIQFKTSTFPNMKGIDTEIALVAEKCYQFLDAAPKYTALKYNLKGEKRLVVKQIKI